MAAARHLWSLPHGRLALALLLIGAIGLTTHTWLPMLAAVALPRGAGSKVPPGTPAPSRPPISPRPPTGPGQPPTPAQPNPQPTKAA